MESKEYRTDLGIIYLGDAWDILPKLPLRSFDLIIADPPYVEYRDIRTQSEEWKLNGKRWISLFNLYSNVLKDNGYLVLFGLPSFFLELSAAILNKFKVRYDLIWLKPNVVDFPKAKERPLDKHEQILVLCKKEAEVSKMTYNYKDIMTKGKPYKRINRSYYDKYIDGILPDYENSEGWRYPSTILEFPSKPYMKREERTEHPTQKPLGLIEWLLKAYTNEDDIVLDTFLGSGTTAVACERLKRRYVAIELNEEWFKVSKERVEKTLKEKNQKLIKYI